MHTKYVVSVCAPNASVVYAVSPLARSDVKSQNSPSNRTSQAYGTRKEAEDFALTLRLSDISYPLCKLLGGLGCHFYARYEAETKRILPLL